MDIDPAKIEQPSEKSLMKIHLLDGLQLKFRGGARKPAPLHHQPVIGDGDLRRPDRYHLVQLEGKTSGADA